MVKGTWNPDASGYSKLIQSIVADDDPSVVAFTFALAGDRDRAFEWLEKAYAIEDADLILVLRYPGLDPIRSDPRYKAFMTKMGLPE